MARMICVLSMIFVHVPDGGLESAAYSLTNGGFGLFLEGLAVEGPGRASAALLSVISGYLAASALMKPGSPVWQLYKRRFLSILVPMVFWGVVTYIVYLVVSQARPTFIDDADGLLDHLNIVLFLTEMPMGATMHLGFLRDLFVCILLSPILLPAIQRMAWLILPILGVFYLIEPSQSAVIILRPLVLFAFCIGIFLALRQYSLKRLDKYWPVFLGLAVMATIAILLANSGVMSSAVQSFARWNLQFDETVLYPLGRLFGSLAIWTLIPFFMGGHLLSWTKRFTPYLFAAFCSHYLMLTLLFYGVWNPLVGGRESVWFIVWFLSAPIVSMAIAVVIVKLSILVSPPLATMITGGRISSQPISAHQERGKQGIALGIWLIATGLLDRVFKPVWLALREWFRASRRLLLGKR